MAQKRKTGPVKAAGVEDQPGKRLKSSVQTNKTIQQETSSVAPKRKNSPSKTVKEEQPNTKRFKGGKATGPGSKDSVAMAVTTESAGLPSTLRQPAKEEPAFPRGGASALTPLEYKEVVNEATRDVLFESNNQSSAAGATNDARKRSNKPPIKSPKKAKAIENGAREPEIKVEPLSYKKLVPGTLVFGLVCKITKKDVALALPDNLVGYVPITSISEQYTEKLKASLTRNDEGSEDEGEMEGEGTNDLVEDENELSSLFMLNQPLRAYVMSTSTSVAGEQRPRKHIGLSLLPKLTNQGLTQNELVVGATLQASVRSMEDKGFIMDVGFDFASGFMDFANCGMRPSGVVVGRIFFCVVVSKSKDGRVLRLSSNFHEAASGNIMGSRPITDASTIDSFLPGSRVNDLLITNVLDNGLVGKILGSVDTSIDLLHCVAWSSEELQRKYKVGMKVAARVIGTFSGTDTKKVAASLLTHLVDMQPKVAKGGHYPSYVLPTGSIVEEAKIYQVIPGVGLIIDVGVAGILAFVHISRISDKKVDSISSTTTPYNVGSQHRARILEYNPTDGLYIASMEEKILSQPFLRAEDVPVGEVIQGKISRFTAHGMLVQIADGIEGYVPEIHMSDVKLQHPEKKFREGAAVKARVLKKDIDRGRIQLTLKKSLVNSDAEIFAEWVNIPEDGESPGTIVKILPTGAIVQFYNDIRGFLPVSEMSEAYIQNPAEHFRVGQVVNVNVLSVDSIAQKLRLTCKGPSSELNEEKLLAFVQLQPGSTVSGFIMEKSNDDIVLELQEFDLKGLLVLGQLTDGSNEKNISAFKKLRAGQKLVDLVVLEKDESRKLIYLSAKPSLLKASKSNIIVKHISDLLLGQAVTGYVRNITDFGIFVSFFGGLTGLLPKGALSNEVQDLDDFGYRRSQSVSGFVSKISLEKEQFTLSLTPPNETKTSLATKTPAPSVQLTKEDESKTPVKNALDPSMEYIEDFCEAVITKAKITSVKPTQLNMDLADNVKGRVDVSELFDSWEDIQNKKFPLLKHGFSVGQELGVKVIGLHNTKSHKYLPVSHRVAGKLPTFELSAKPSQLSLQGSKILSYGDLRIGETSIAYVNNVQADCIWVSLSPSVRGRIKLFDISDNVSVLNNLEKHFPPGAALRASVLEVEVTSGKLELSCRSITDPSRLNFEAITNGMLLPGRVSKVTDNKVIIQLTDDLYGSVSIADMSDDFDKADMKTFEKDSFIRVCVLRKDVPNNRLYLTTRSSRVLDSSANVKDKEIRDVKDLSIGQICRGFVTNVADNGLYVHLGGSVVARARIADLRDAYVKEWKKDFRINQIVKGKVMAIDLDTEQVTINLKQSVVNGTAKRTLADYKEGDVVDGHVRKVTDIGCFIVIDGSDNVSGLCHKSQMTDAENVDTTKLYATGDLVKVKIIRTDRKKGRISFSLKASNFTDLTREELGAEDPSESLVIQAGESDADLSDDETGGVALIPEHVTGLTINGVDRNKDTFDGGEGLLPAKFDWSGNVVDSIFADERSDSDSSSDEEAEAKPKRKRNAIKVDLTGDMDSRDPESASDFERLLLATPGSPLLWMQYMAFYLAASEVPQARAVAERALKTIDVRDEEAKLNIWVALLNLEESFGTDETMDVTFKKACQYNDAQKVHEKLCSIYITDKKNEKAEEVFQQMVKKFSQDPKVWLNYGSYLMENGKGDDARRLIPRAIQAIQSQREHPDLTMKFAQLEYRFGEFEKGRTLFETLLDAYPKRLDIWNVYIDVEIKQGDKDIVRRLFPRVLAQKLSVKKAKFVFKKWLAFEEKVGDRKSIEGVKQKAAEYVKNMAERAEANMTEASLED